MNLYTVVYRPIDDEIYPSLKATPDIMICRVWANDLDSLIKRCNNTLGRVHFVLEGHPEILTHTAEQIPTYDWGKSQLRLDSSLFR